MAKRLDIIFDCKNSNIKSLNNILEAISAGSSVIKTSLSFKEANKTESTYDDQGKCLTVGVYNNEFYHAFKKLGLNDIRYGSTNGWKFGLAEGEYSDSYTIYPPKGWNPSA